MLETTWHLSHHNKLRLTEILQGLTRDATRMEHFLAQWDLIEPRVPRNRVRWHHRGHHLMAGIETPSR